MMVSWQLELHSVVALSDHRSAGVNTEGAFIHVKAVASCYTVKCPNQHSSIARDRTRREWHAILTLHGTLSLVRTFPEDSGGA